MLALCLMLSSVVHAATPGDAQTYLLSAKRLFEDLNYEGALTQLQLARQVPRSREQEVTLLLYEGVMLAELARWDESSSAFRDALVLDPDATLPMRVSPKVEQRFESLREQAQNQKKARLAPTPPRKTAPAESVPPTGSAKAMGSPPQQSPSPEVAAHSEPGVRSRSFLVPAIAGGGLVVAGGISWTLSRRELNRLRTGASSLMTEEDVQHSVSRGNTLQTIGLACLGAGTAGLLTAAGMYVFGKKTEPVTLGVGTNGSAAFIYGGW